MGAGTTVTEKTSQARKFDPVVPGCSNNYYENFIYLCHVIFFLVFQFLFSLAHFYCEVDLTMKSEPVQN